MTIELALIFAAASCMIGVAGFIGGKQSVAKTDGVWKGQLDTNVEHIKDDLKEIKATMSVTQTATDNAMEKMRKDYKESVSNVHDRLDSHLREDHGMVVPQRRKLT